MFRMLSCVLLLGLIARVALADPSVAYSKVKAGGTVAHAVTIDLTNPDVRVSVALAKGGAGRSESFKSIVKRTRPSAAVTGTFFDTKTLIPTGDIALFGRIVHSGCIGSALCIDSANKASIVPLREGRKTGWAGYETVLCAGPSLLAKGRISIALKHEGFRGSLHSSTRRVGAGLTSSGKLVMVAVNRKASLYALAKLMLEMGVTDAVCLDGGSSTALYHEGSFLAVPSRSLTNLLVVYSKSEDYQNARCELAPVQMLAKNDPPARTSVEPFISLGLVLPPMPASAPTFGSHQ